MSTQLQQELSDLSSLNCRLEKAVEVIGQEGLTPERIIEMFAEITLPERVDGLRFCPGYGGAHVWAWLDNRPASRGNHRERCDSHPERRTVKDRRK